MKKIGKVDLDDDDNPDFLFTMPKANKDVNVKDLGYEIFVDDVKGRGIRATRDFKVGNLVLKAEPFAYVIFDHMSEHVCHQCFNMVVRDRQGQPTSQLLRCSSCKFARYCSRECQKKAWPTHKKECMAIKVRINQSLSTLHQNDIILEQMVISDLANRAADSIG